MENGSPNILAVIVMAVVYMAIGWAWYSPKVFGDKIVCAHKNEMQNDDKSCKDCWKSYVAEFVLACVMGYVLADFAIGMNRDTFMSGVSLGFWAWLGFVATTLYSKVLWGSGPIVNFYISSGFYLVLMMLMGGVLAIWR
jgi:hypothetical protein